MHHRFCIVSLRKMSPQICLWYMWHNYYSNKCVLRWRTDLAGTRMSSEDLKASALGDSAITCRAQGIILTINITKFISLTGPDACLGLIAYIYQAGYLP
jgi:hypothetical protein